MRVRTHTNPFNYHKRMETVDFAAAFPDYSGVLDFEIGFGRGVFLRQYAKQFPDRFIVGVEVRPALVDLLSHRLAEEHISNVLPVHGTAEICLEDMIEDASIQRLFVFHPDPWFKKRHHKRRVINKQTLALYSRKLKKGGRLYLSTDVRVLWDDMASAFDAAVEFEAVSDKEFWDHCYQSHWHRFSLCDQRDLHCGTFQCCV